MNKVIIIFTALVVIFLSGCARTASMSTRPVSEQTWTNHSVENLPYSDNVDWRNHRDEDHTQERLVERQVFYIDQDGLVRDEQGEVKIRKTCQRYGNTSDQCILALKRDFDQNTSDAQDFARERTRQLKEWLEYCRPRKSCGDSIKERFRLWRERE